jgi:hypothetical protein
LKEEIEFLQEYLAHEAGKHARPRQQLSERYQRPTLPHYHHMVGGEQFDFPEENLTYYVRKLVSLNTLLALVVVAFVLMHEQIYRKIG